MIIEICVSPILQQVKFDIFFTWRITYTKGINININRMYKKETWSRLLQTLKYRALFISIVHTFAHLQVVSIYANCLGSKYSIDIRNVLHSLWFMLHIYHFIRYLLLKTYFHLKSYMECSILAFSRHFTFFEGIPPTFFASNSFSISSSHFQ